MTPVLETILPGSDRKIKVLQERMRPIGSNPQVDCRRCRPLVQTTSRLEQRRPQNIIRSQSAITAHVGLPSPSGRAYDYDWCATKFGDIRAILKTMIDQRPRPAFTPRPVRHEWYIHVEWPDGRFEHIQHFQSESEAQRWIVEKSERWLRLRGFIL